MRKKNGIYPQLILNHIENKSVDYTESNDHSMQV